MITHSYPSLGLTLSLSFLLSVKPGLAVPLFGQGVSEARTFDTINGTLERILGSTALVVRVENGTDYRAYFQKRFAHALRGGRRVPLGYLRAGESVIVTGRGAPKAIFADTVSANGRTAEGSVR